MSAGQTGRTSSAGTDLMYRPRPHSWSTTNETDARHSPGSGHHTQPSCSPRTQAPSCHTSTGRGGSIRRIQSSGTPPTVGAATSIDRAPKPCLHKRAAHTHGTRDAYVLDRCRCFPCCAANSDYETRRVRLKAYGRGTPTGLVDAGPARAHVERLQASGMGWKRIAAAADVANGTMTRLFFGKKDGDRRFGPSKRIRSEIADRILAVTMPTVDQLGGGQPTDGTGTRRRLQALVAIGWTQSELAERLGMSTGNFGSLIHCHRRKPGSGDVLASTVVAVAGLYDQLWATPGPERYGRSRAIAVAQRHGWAPPLAWDDDTIDDPAAAPQLGDDADLVDELAVAAVLEGVRMRLAGKTLHAAVHALADTDHQPADIADRLGIGVMQAYRLRERPDAPRPRREAS